MKDEIKEILDYIDDRIIPNEKWNKIKDYITNLQEKYERMKENAKILSNGYDALEKKNEKAIEYFKYQLEQLDFYEDTKAKMLCAMGIVILQGDDKE